MFSRVLLVEDDPLIRSVMLHNLAKTNSGCYAVASGEEAVELAEFFDLILMDVELPGISGLEAAKRIRQCEITNGWGTVPVVATTIWDNRAECLAAGMNDHYLKPLLRDDLARLLREWTFERPYSARAAFC
jgi:two-component system sensor histidine kinase/response regulator